MRRLQDAYEAGAPTVAAAARVANATVLDVWHVGKPDKVRASRYE